MNNGFKLHFKFKRVSLRGGKTSLVEYLAERTGHRFMRINNHEHTDLQEYLGSYVTDANGGGDAWERT